MIDIQISNGGMMSQRSFFAGILSKNGFHALQILKIEAIINI